jgi:hypothetical protein
MASGATCVQRLDDSRDSAIHTKYRISLRSSSMREPRYPLPRVVLDKYKTSTPARTSCPRRPATLFGFSSLAHSAPGFGLRTRLPRSLRMVCGQTGGTGFPRPFGDERPRSPSPRVVITRSRVVLLGQVSTMILPQVHLRKPCYDFSFL